MPVSSRLAPMGATKISAARCKQVLRAYLTKDVLHDEMLRAIHAVHAGGKYLPASVSAALESSTLPSRALSAREMDVLSLIVKGRGK